MYDIHPQTLRLYEREGLLKPSRTEGNTRLYTDEDIERLELILSLARDLGVNISGIAIILQMRERMDEMQRQMADFVTYVRNEVMARAQHADAQPRGARAAAAWHRHQAGKEETVVSCQLSVAAPRSLAQSFFEACSTIFQPPIHCNSPYLTT